MRIAASACLVLAILFMVGCGTSAEDKTAIKANTDAIAALQKQVTDMSKAAGDMNAKVMAIEKFLGDKNAKIGTYGMPPDTTKKPAEVVKGKPAAPAAPKKAPEPKKEPGKTK